MTLWTGAGGGLLISILGRLNLSHLTVQVTGAIVKVDGSVLDEKLSFKVLELSFSLFWDWGLFIVTIAKTPRTLKHFLFTDVSFL